MPFTNPLFGASAQPSLVNFGGRVGEPQGSDSAGTVTILNDPQGIFNGVDNSDINVRGAIIKNTGTYRCRIKSNYSTRTSTPGGVNSHLTGCTFNIVLPEGGGGSHNGSLNLYTLGTDTFTANGTSTDIVISSITGNGMYFGTTATFFGSGFTGGVGPSLTMEISKIA